ncbi:hypothetical protein IAR55_003704 [Kwoniella newhampshirensis]|uniref:Rab-GAP TBC domain-containing protein n=1 Tax=Kwoniella newhampshirensis TaxID=1651941 RepID=A0AAW0YSA5_9TREE
MADHPQPRSPLIPHSIDENNKKHPLAHPSLARRSSNHPSSHQQSDTQRGSSPSIPPPHRHRPHAATVSGSRPTHRSSATNGGLSEADLLGVGPSQRHLRRGSKTSPSLSSAAGLEDVQGHHLDRPQSQRADSSGSRPLLSYLDSLGRDEMAIVETRFDLLSDGELSQYLESLPGPSRTRYLATDRSSSEQDQSHTLHVEENDPSLSRVGTPPSDKSPLFPPSPPSLPSKQDAPDHPLRVLSRAVRELREVVAKLELENERLREETRARSIPPRKVADRMSIHDGLTEAISTSLTSDSPIHDLSSKPFPSEATHRPSSPAPSTTRSIRPRSPASSISVPFSYDPPGASSNYARSIDSTSSVAIPNVTPSTSKPINRQSWASGLWAWNASKKTRPRKGSIGSIASSVHVPSSPIVQQSASESALVDEEDEEGWRRGDGGSSPSFRAIFLATRIITPDPSSILTSPEIPPNSLIAYLAHSLVSNARDEGILARIPPDQRHRSRDSHTRSRAASIASQDSVGMTVDPSSSSSAGTPLKDQLKGHGYGDQALAATASLGRSLLSSVSSATLRGTKAISGLSEETRPSLLSRTSSSRGFPTTAVSPPSGVQVGGSHHSPSEETPPPSVELSSIVPDEARPPTVLLSRQNLGSFFQSTKVSKTKMATASRFESDEEPLTDRYGFIYDIQHAKMLKDASVAGTPAPMSLNGMIPRIDEETEGWIAKRRRNSRGSQRSDISKLDRANERPDDQGSITSPRRSIDSTDANSKSPDSTTPPRSRSSSRVDHSRHRSTTLMSLNPSPAKPITAQDQLTVSARGASSLQPRPHTAQSVAELSTSAPLSASATLAHPSSPAEPVHQISASRLTISSLLDQLTDIHDRQQKERLVEWDAFLKRRAKSKAATRGSTESGTAASGGRGRRQDEMRWGTGLIGISQIGLSGKTGQDDWRSFTKLVRHGIPMTYRSDVWAECSGAKDLMVPGEYSEILTVHANDTSSFLADIEKDVGRTFPGNVFFGGDGPGVGKLRRVLVAYSWHNPAVGYCQGMNMLAATLLLTHTDEEQAYWVLTCLVDRLLPPNYFVPSLLASRADQLVLSELVAQLVPKVYHHLEKLGVDLASVTFGWFLSLFTDCLPVETLFRVWDVFFVEGHDTLFRVAIAILKLNENEICNCESVSDLFSFISSMTSRLWGADRLIALQHSYKPIIRHIDVVARCERAVAIIQKEMDGE